VETGKNNFGDSVHGLINFRLILIRNYIFLILKQFYLIRKIAQPFSLIQRGTWEGSTAVFPYSKATWWPCVVICKHLYIFTLSAKHKLPTLIKPRQ